MVQAHDPITQAFKHLTFNPLVTYNRVQVNDTNENDGVSSNGKMIALAWSSASSVAVFNAETPKNFDANTPLLKGHRGNIFDMQWSPFDDKLLATCADDGLAKFWKFDDYNGLTEHRTDCYQELEAHSRKCTSVQWHSAAENLLATHSIDKTIKIWDIDEDRCDDPIFTFTDMPDQATSIRWSPDGKMIAGCVKNKSLVIFDPRQDSSVIKADGHAGPRQQRLQWADNETLITSGFDREAKRQWGAYDLRDISAPLM